MPISEIAKLAALKLKGEWSCRGCQCLHSRDYGYSNYTTTDTDVDCIRDKNPNLPAPIDDSDFNWDIEHRRVDRFFATREGRCEHYTPRPEGIDPVHYDVDGKLNIAEQVEHFDPEVRVLYIETDII